jgi:hypothetical protein
MAYCLNCLNTIIEAEQKRYALHRRFVLVAQTQQR